MLKANGFKSSKVKCFRAIGLKYQPARTPTPRSSAASPRSPPSARPSERAARCWCQPWRRAEAPTVGMPRHQRHQRCRGTSSTTSSDWSTPYDQMSTVRWYNKTELCIWSVARCWYTKLSWLYNHCRRIRYSCGVLPNGLAKDVCCNALSSAAVRRCRLTPPSS